MPTPARIALPLLLLSILSACATPPAPPPPAVHAPPATARAAGLLENVAAFAKPTSAERLPVLKQQLDAAGLAWTVEEFDGGTAKSPMRGANVTISTGPATGREILLVAHYDAISLRNGQVSHGVVDNAASVVAMIETAARVSGQTKHPVRLLLTDQEELGLLGAKAFIAAHGVTNLAAVINADINASGDALMYGLNTGAQSAGLVAAVRDLCAARQMTCVEFADYPPSDDRAFSAAGAPTVSLGFQPEADALALRAFMDGGMKVSTPSDVPEVLRVIHTDRDRIALVDPATVAKAADVFTALVLKLDAELP